MSKFVAVNAAAFREFLVPKKFRESRSGHEITFVGRMTKAPHVAIVVYTACTAGYDTARVRGSDAVRVVVKVHAGKIDEKIVVAGLHTATRIVRTGTTEAVLARVSNRIAEGLAWAKSNLRMQPCALCGAAVWQSGKCVNRECFSLTQAPQCG